MLHCPGSEGEGSPPACPVSPTGEREGENQKELNATSSSGLNWYGTALRVAGLAVRERLLPRVLPSPPTRLAMGKCARVAVSAVLQGPGQAAQLGYFVFAYSISPTRCRERKQEVCREGKVYLTQPHGEVGAGHTGLGSCLSGVALVAP